MLSPIHGNISNNIYGTSASNESTNESVKTTTTSNATIVEMTHDAAYESFKGYTANDSEYYSNNGYMLNYDPINNTALSDDSMMTMLSMFINPGSGTDSTPHQTTDNVFTVLAEEHSETSSTLEGYQDIYDSSQEATPETGLTDMISNSGGSENLTDTSEQANMYAQSESTRESVSILDVQA